MLGQAWALLLANRLIIRDQVSADCLPGTELAAGAGVEPAITDPESAVIPLHHPAAIVTIMAVQRATVKAIPAFTSSP